MTELVHRFRSLSESLCELIESEGLLIRPYQVSTLPFFQALSEDEQTLAIVHLQNYFEICRSTVMEGGSLRDQRALVNKALKHFRLEMAPNVIQKTNANMVYEFYSLGQTQYFRTVNFFEFNSYTVEDIYSRCWFNLYVRDEDITGKILNFANQIAMGKTTDVILPDIREHVVIERASLEKLKVPVRLLCLAPLTQNKRTVGIVSVIQCAGNFYD